MGVMRSEKELSIVDEELFLFHSLGTAHAPFLRTERTSVTSVCSLTCLPRAVMRICRLMAIEVLPAIHALRLSRLSRATSALLASGCNEQAFGKLTR